MVTQIGCAVVNSAGGLIVLRFISGLFCSPALATIGATIVDIITPQNVIPITASWSGSCLLAHVTAPLVGACMVVKRDWRWIFWFMTFFYLVILIFFFPETSHSTILARRAKRLRMQTGDFRYYTVQEKLDALISTKEFLLTTFYRPIKMILKELSILAFDIYTAVTYGLLYLYFESFPIVFTGIYNFTLIQLGLSYTGFSVGTVCGYFLLLTFTFKYVNLRRANDTFTPKTYLILLMWIGCLMPFSLFLFGWTASVHWILPTISEGFFIIACFNLFQVTFSYFSEDYSQYVASAYGGNSAMRSSFACAFPLFRIAMYNRFAVNGYLIA